MTADATIADKPAPWRRGLTLTPEDFALARAPTKPVHAIVTEVCEKHGLTWLQMTSPRRTRVLAHARQEAWWRCIKETRVAFKELARLFNRDHATVFYGVEAHGLRLAKAKAAIGNAEMKAARLVQKSDAQNGDAQHGDKRGRESSHARARRRAASW